MTLPNNELLDLDAIRDARAQPPQAICGVYFLFRGLDIIYIGKSVNVVSRMLKHVRERDFDACTIIECQPDELADLETAYILKFKPPENGAQNEYPPEMRLFTYKSPEEWRLHYRSVRQIHEPITNEAEVS